MIDKHEIERFVQDNEGQTVEITYSCGPDSTETVVGDVDAWGNGGIYLEVKSTMFISFEDVVKFSPVA